MNFDEFWWPPWRPSSKQHFRVVSKVCLYEATVSSIQMAAKSGGPNPQLYLTIREYITDFPISGWVCKSRDKMLVTAHPRMAKLDYDLYERSSIKQCDKCSILKSCFSGQLPLKF